jgi:hypothetical protein
LPQIFSENRLAILPISRGDYVISNFEVYKKFESISTKVIQASLPEHIQSLDKNNIQSEAISINCALASGILIESRLFFSLFIAAIYSQNKIF